MIPSLRSKPIELTERWEAILSFRVLRPLLSGRRKNARTLQDLADIKDKFVSMNIVVIASTVADTLLLLRGWSVSLMVDIFGLIFADPEASGL